MIYLKFQINSKFNSFLNNFILCIILHYILSNLCDTTSGANDIQVLNFGGQLIDLNKFSSQLQRFGEINYKNPFCFNSICQYLHLNSILFTVIFLYFQFNSFPLKMWINSIKFNSRIEQHWSAEPYIWFKLTWCFREEPSWAAQ